MRITYTVEGDADELATFTSLVVALVKDSLVRAPAETVAAEVTEEWLDDLYAAEEDEEKEADEVEEEADLDEEVAEKNWKKDLPRLSETARNAAFEAFKKATQEWARGFGDLDPSIEQPNRLEILRELGSGPHAMPVLVMAYELESLQELVVRALDLKHATHAQAQDLAHQIAGNMVQISHLAYPDLAGTFDHSTKWRMK